MEPLKSSSLENKRKQNPESQEWRAPTLKDEQPSASLRSVALVAAVLGLSVLLSGCAGALLEEGLVESALLRTAPVGVAEVGLAEEAAMGLTVGAADGIGTRAILSAGEEVGTVGRMGLVEGGATRIAGVGSAEVTALVEARIASVAGRSGLAGVLEDMTALNPVLDNFGAISVEGRTILTASESFIRVPSSGQVLGQIRDTKIFAVDSLGRSTVEVGEVYSNTRVLSSQNPIQVIRIKPNWYRVVIGNDAISGPEDFFVLGGAKDQEKKDLDKVSQRVTTVVRPDPRTGNLVRSIVAVPQTPFDQQNAVVSPKPNHIIEEIRPDGTVRYVAR